VWDSYIGVLEKHAESMNMENDRICADYERKIKNLHKSYRKRLLELEKGMKGLQKENQILA
jgi:hypothetical protein